MQEALPYRPWSSSSTSASSILRHNHVLRPELVRINEVDHDGHSSNNSLQKMLSENAIIIFGRQGCCMTCVVKSLLLAVGANPSIFEVDDDEGGADVVQEGVHSELSKFVDDLKAQLPVVFVGGKFFGGLERVMAAHISGELVPILKEAGALWL